MRLNIRGVIGALVVTVGLVAGLVAVTTPSASAAAAPCPPQNTSTPQNVPVTASSQAKVTNIVVTATRNDIRVQFDYALVNGATTATVDASLQTQQSFGPVAISGPGHFDETLTGVNNGSYSISIISTGNPDYEVVNTTGQPLVITLPATATTPTPPTTGGGLLARLVAALLQFLHRYF